MYDVGPLPDIVTTLLLAMCDPNNQGAPPRSTLEVAIRREEAQVVELLLQYRANPHLREPGQELPIIVAASRGALTCKNPPRLQSGPGRHGMYGISRTPWSKVQQSETQDSHGRSSSFPGGCRGTADSFSYYQHK